MPIREMPRAQDIHIQDKAAWQSFVTAWDNATTASEYEAAIAQLEVNLPSEYVAAGYFEKIRDWLLILNEYGQTPWTDRNTYRIQIINERGIPVVPSGETQPIIPVINNVYFRTQSE